MAAKSPTMSVKSREMIGEEQFSQRREVFGKHDTVFLPPASPTPASYREVDPIVTSNHGKTTTNFKRNTPGYSSMRESRTDERVFDFRPRKYSDNFTSELNQSDDVEYRHTMTERTRRLSKMRRDFMTSNLHEPGSTSPFNRSGTRASMPANTNTSPLKYKIESPNLYKFPFAEPYSTPTPVRRVIVDLGSADEEGGGKENQDPERPRHQSLTQEPVSKVDQQKLFEEILKRYSPQRKPVDWQLPPTKPRVVASVPKSNSSVADSTDSGDKNDKHEKGDDDVFEKKQNGEVLSEKSVEHPVEVKTEVIQNGPESLSTDAGPAKESDSKTSQSELDEKQDQVPELSTIQRQLSKDSAKKPLENKIVDLSIPALIQKMTAEGDSLEKTSRMQKKVKRKRSFLDKLLGRKKDK